MTLADDADAFAYRGARSPSLLAAVATVLLIETVVLHLLLVGRHPLVAWALTAGSALTLVWLAADHRAMGSGRVRVHPAEVEVHVGRRLRGTVPRALIARAVAPTWRDIPEVPDGYLDATRPAEPNVLLALRAPVTMRLFGMPRRVRLIALHLDEPARFLAAISVDTR